MSATFRGLRTELSKVGDKHVFVGEVYSRATMKQSKVFVGCHEARLALSDEIGDDLRNRTFYVRYYDIEREEVSSARIKVLRQKVESAKAKLRAKAVDFVEKAKGYKVRTCGSCGKKADMAEYHQLFNMILANNYGHVYRSQLICRHCKAVDGAPITKNQGETLQSLSDAIDKQIAALNSEIEFECSKLSHLGKVKVRAYLGGWFSNPPVEDEDDYCEDDDY